MFRIHAAQQEKVSESKDAIENVRMMLTNINIIDLDKHIKVVESSMSNDYLLEVKNTLDNFLNKIKTIQNEHTKA